MALEELETYKQHIRALIESNHLDHITRYEGSLNGNISQFRYDKTLLDILIESDDTMEVNSEMIQKIISTIFFESERMRCHYHTIHDRYGLDTIIVWIERGWIDLRDPWFIPNVLTSSTIPIHNKLSYMDRLIELGLNVNDDTSGKTNLFGCFLSMPMYSLDYNDIRQIVCYLLEKGADPLLEGRSGLNAFDILYIKNSFRYKINPELFQWLITELMKWANGEVDLTRCSYLLIG